MKYNIPLLELSKLKLGLFLKHTFLMCLILLSYSYAFTEGDDVEANHVQIPGVCCPKYAESYDPCMPLENVTAGKTYLKYLVIDVEGDNTIDSDVTNLSLVIEDPNENRITPESVEYFYVVNDSLTSTVSFPFAVPANTTKYIAAKILFKFSPNSGTPVLAGEYTFTITVDGNKLFNPIVPFANSAMVSMDLAETCSTSYNLVEIPDPERLGVPSILAPKWHPNPTHNSAILELDLEKESKVDVEIMDMQGRILMQPLFDQNLKSGMNRRKLDVSQLAAGIYYTRITTETETQVIKWVKLE